MAIFSIKFIFFPYPALQLFLLSLKTVTTGNEPAIRVQKCNIKYFHISIV